MSETIDVIASTVKDDRSGWQAEDQIAVEYLDCLLYTSPSPRD